MKPTSSSTSIPSSSPLSLSSHRPRPPSSAELGIPTNSGGGRGLFFSAGLDIGLKPSRGSRSHFENENEFHSRKYYQMIEPELCLLTSLQTPTRLSFDRCDPRNRLKTSKTMKPEGFVGLGSGVDDSCKHRFRVELGPFTHHESRRMLQNL